MNIRSLGFSVLKQIAHSSYKAVITKLTFALLGPSYVSISECRLSGVSARDYFLALEIQVKKNPLLSSF